MESGWGNLVQTDWSQDYFYYLKKGRDGKNILSEQRLNQIKDLYQMKSAYLNRNILYDSKNSSVSSMLKKKIDKCIMNESNFLMGCEPERKIDYYKVKNKVRFWTNYFTYGIPTEDFINPSERLATFTPEFCFKTVISSREFTLAIRSKQGQNALYRHIFAGNEMTVQQAEKEISKQLSHIDGESMLQKEILAEFQKNAISKEAREQMEMDFNFLYRGIAEEFAKRGFEELKKKFRNSVADLFQVYANNNMLTKDIVQKGTLSVTHGNNKEPFLVISLRQEGILAQEKKKKDQYNDIVEMIINALSTTVSEINHMSRLDLMSIGYIDIEPNVQESFYKKAKEYCKSPVVKQAITDILAGKKSIDEIAGITGLIGELIGILNFKNIAEMKSTGAIKDTGKLFNGQTIDLGESYADLMTKYGGVNIKHYLSADRVLTLYEPKKESSGYPILGKDIVKYIPLEQLAVMRFIDANYSYVHDYCGIDYSNNTLIQKYQNVALLNLDNFIRQSAVMEDSKDVAFYQLNNLIVPSSEIFKMINEKGFNLDKLFKIIIEHIQYDEYIKSTEATDKNHLLQNFYTTKGSTIRFNGLKVNLGDLSSMLKG